MEIDASVGVLSAAERRFRLQNGNSETVHIRSIA